MLSEIIMNREFKFRLRDENNKIVGYEKWCEDVFNMETKKDYYVANPRWLYSVGGDNWTLGLIEHRYKDQFTDLCDRDGKEIFEGDIVEVIKSEGNYKGYVVFIAGGFQVQLGQLGIGFRGHDSVKILGSVHQNPELLKD